MDRSEDEQDAISSIVEQLLVLLLDHDGKIKSELTVILGAGASREYGVPTSVEMARRFFESGLSSRPKEGFVSSPQWQNVDEAFGHFIEEFGGRLDTDVAYAFFKGIEKQNKALIQSGDVLTYDRLLQLWDQGYIKFIATTNFDNILEVRLENRKTEGELKAFDLVVIDYYDLNKNDRPRLVDGNLFVKLAGVIDRSNMLWTEKQFQSSITAGVKEWLEQAISDTPLLLLGYTASEEPLREVLSKHNLFAACVAPQPLAGIQTLNSLSAIRKRPLNHAEATAGKFIQLLYERIYEQTGNDALSLSFGYVRARIERLMKSLRATAPNHRVIERGPIEKVIAIQPERRSKNDRLLILLGESGCGKSTLLLRYTQQSENGLCLLIPAVEVSQGLKEWCKRLGAADLAGLCAIAAKLGKSLTLFIDGLNEEVTAGQAHHILGELTAILDQLPDPAIRAVVSCRTDFWNRSGLSVTRSYCPKPLELGTFSDTELDEAVNLAEASGLQVSRQPFLLEMLKLPENLGFALELPKGSGQIASERDLLTALLEKRIYELRFNEGPLIWLCREMRSQQSVSIDVEAANVSERRFTYFERAQDAGLLTINRFLVVRFREDRLGEFYFGRNYLYSACWRETDSKDSIGNYFKCLVEEYHAIAPEHAAFKAMFLNGLSFFLCACTEEEFQEIYRSEDSFTCDIARSSAILKRSVTFDRLYLDDPVLMALCLLNASNHDKMWEVLNATDVRFLSGLPFAFGAKLYPDAFADFTAGVIDRALQASSDQAIRTSLSLACCCVLFLGLKQGIGWLLSHARLRAAIKNLCRLVSRELLVSRVVEVLTDNSKLLFHWHPTAKLDDIFDVQPRVRKALLSATQSCVFDLSIPDIIDAVNSSPCARLIVQFLFFRDYRDNRLEFTLHELFNTGDLAIQDFVVGVLGFCAKSDHNYIPLSEKFVRRMAHEYSANFYAASIYDNEGIFSQYDPLVPHATTVLGRSGSFDWTEFIAEHDPRSVFRIGRLAQKTVLDFPAETIEYIKVFLQSKAEPNEEILTVLATAELLFPDVYWRAMKSLEVESYSIHRPQTEAIERIITQIRDYEWSHTYAFLCSSEMAHKWLNSALLHLLSSHDLDDWIRRGLMWLEVNNDD